MLHPFGRHAGTFARALDRGEYTRTDAGIVFPRLGALLAGRLNWRAHDRAGRLCGEGAAHNLLTSYALSALREGLLPVGAGHFDIGASSLYIAPWSSDLFPDATWTDFYLAFVAGELGDGPEGYSELSRQAWSAVDAGSGLVTNTAAPAAFTIVTASQLPICGYALIGSGNTKRSGITDSGYAPFDPTTVLTDVLDFEEDTAYGHHRIQGLNAWYDPTNDDIFDSLDGHWVDPALDDFSIVGDPQSVFAVVRTAGGSPDLFNNGDTFSVTYELQVSA